MDLNRKLNQYFPGKVVRKDLTKMIKEGANVPVYVLEYLLGMYCATEDEEQIKEGIKNVKEILSKNYVRPDESELIKSKIKEKGRYKIIDKVIAKLNEKLDRYEAEFTNLGLKSIYISEEYIKKYEKLLAGGIWSIITLTYYYDEHSIDSPFILTDLKPIQIPFLDITEFKEQRKNFTLDEWIDVIIRSIGLEPTNLTDNVKWHLILRLVPFVENNYNMCELGPRGTGKSYVYKELSTNSILISGGQTTVANLFYNMARRTIGLVGLWDVVAFDEVAGIKFKDKDGIQIMKDYMESGSFVRGREPIEAKASFVFIGNIDGSIENLVKTSHLLTPFPKEMIDSAFFDRFHYYLPGWEIPKMRPEYFTDEFGFITDYFAECMRELQKDNFSDAIERYFRFGKDLNQRDVKAVKKTVSGMLKLLFPDGNFTKDDVKRVLEYALIGRRRIKEQLKKIGGMEFYDVHFSYIDLETNEETFVSTPESGSGGIIPEGELPPGTVFVIGYNAKTGKKGLVRLDLQKMSGNGKFTNTGFGNSTETKDEIKEALNFTQANLNRVSLNLKFKDFDYHMKATNLNGIENLKGLELAIFISFVSGITEKPVLPQLVVIGSMSIGGVIIQTPNLAETLQIASDSGAKRVLLPVADVQNFSGVPSELLSKFQLIMYSNPVEAAFKAVGVG